MPVYFQASELLEASIRIEKNGEAFYRGIGKKLKDPKAVELFDYLSKEDARHAGIFSEILQKIGTYEPDGESYPGEYRAYLKTFADHHIFNKENTGLLLANRMHSSEDILNFAIRIELESMFFYMEVKHYVPKTQMAVIDQIVEEERSHYLKLIQLQPTISKL